MTSPPVSNPVFSSPDFSNQVSARFSRQAHNYAHQARLQVAVVGVNPLQVKGQQAIEEAAATGP